MISDIFTKGGQRKIRRIHLHAGVQRTLDTTQGSIRGGTLELPSTRPNPAKPRPGIEPMNL